MATMHEDDELLRTQEKVVRLQALLEASRRVHAAADLERILHTSLSIVVKELELRGAYFSHFPHQFGDLPSDLQKLDAEQRPQYVPTGGAISFPLLDKAGALLTEFVVFPFGEGSLSLEETDFIEGLALQTAVAIENARFHERTMLMEELRREQEKARSLLLNILPKKVAEDLQEGISERKLFKSATICFTDFVGFGKSTLTLSAESLVEELHVYFTAFDEIMDRYGLEKLKTIGDSYMFASGLPTPRAGNAVDAVLAAMELREAVIRLAQRPGSPAWQVRIGLHTGPVVAGVVGLKKFAYDIWGDSVNIASRMEALGTPSEINISSGTYAQVKDFFLLECRGKIMTKEAREVEMFFVRGCRPEFVAGGGAAAFAQKYQSNFGETLPAFPIASSDQ